MTVFQMQTNKKADTEKVTLTFVCDRYVRSTPHAFADLCPLGSSIITQNADISKRSIVKIM